MQTPDLHLRQILQTGQSDPETLRNKGHVGEHRYGRSM